jgi:hypothetical protein
MLQAFAIERRAAERAAEDETFRAGVGRRPNEVADAQETSSSR